MGKLTDLYKNEGDIPDALKDYYTKTDDGWVLDGVDDTGSRGRISEFRSTNIKQRRDLEALEDKYNALQDQYKNMDPEQYKQALEMFDQIKEDEEKTLIKQGKIDEVVSRRTAVAIEDSQTQLKAKDEALKKSQSESNKLKNRLGELLIDREIQLKLSTAKVTVQDGALPDVLSRVRDTWKINEEGQMIPMETDSSTGKVQTRYGKDANPLTMEEYVTGLVNSAPHLFRPSTGGGGPGKEHDGITKIGQKKVVDMSDPVAVGQNLEEIAKGNVTDSNKM